MTHKLLLADDSVTIQRVVELMFSGEDVQVITVGDGEEAIARIPVERPDIVLADIAMPKRSGYEVSAFVKGQPDLSHIPVLLLAGAFEPVDHARAQHVQSDGVFVKPFEPQQLVSRVKDLIEAAVTGGLENRGSGSPESRAASAEQRTIDPEDLRLDDYFERLDAAFAQLGSDTDRHLSPPVFEPDEYDRREVPTLEGLLGSSTKPEASHDTIRPGAPAAERTPAPPAGIADARPPMDGRNLVAEMFAALFAAEESEAALPIRAQPPRPEPLAVTDRLVDEVTRRVIERLAPGTASELVTQIVSEVAERLVREEIASIKAGVAARL